MFFFFFFGGGFKLSFRRPMGVLWTFTKVLTRSFILQYDVSHCVHFVWSQVIFHGWVSGPFIDVCRSCLLCRLDTCWWLAFFSPRLALWVQDTPVQMIIWKLVSLLEWTCAYLKIIKNLKISKVWNMTTFLLEHLLLSFHACCTKKRRHRPFRAPRERSFKASADSARPKQHRANLQLAPHTQAPTKGSRRIQQTWPKIHADRIIFSSYWEKNKSTYSIHR